MGRPRLVRQLERLPLLSDRQPLAYALMSLALTPFEYASGGPWPNNRLAVFRG